MFQLILKLITSKLGKAVGLLIFIVLLFVVRALVFPGTPLIYWMVTAVVAALVWIGWIVYQNRKSKEANEAISGHLVNGAQADEASASPQKREVYRKARENLQYAISLLEKSSPKGYEGSALYRLPWILVVGPPSDGKTTAISNAGIRWPQDPRFDEAGGGAKKRGVDGAGGTRSCNWFFSSDAIILDTAGRWQSRDQGEIDENEWLQFLEMLQKYRPKRPVNGIVALVSIERILAGRETSQEWAQKVRRQINEVMEKLGTHVPVYLVFNKCDLIHGFIEFFQGLDKESRKQIWGFTRKYKPLLRKSGEGQESERETIMADLDREMDSLHEVLQQQRLHRLSDPELFPSERAALCIFPGEFSQMIEPIREFISDAFYENPYGHNPTLRGVYFTSATQYEGNPILQLMKQVAGEYDIPAEALPLSTRQAVDTYFLHDLMLDVVFKDEHLGGRFKKSLFDRSRKMMAIGLGLVTLLLSIWMGVSYAVNSSKNEKLISKVQRVKIIPAGNTDPVKAIIALDSLRTGIEDYASTGFPFGVFYWAFGRGDHGDITEVARKWMVTKAEEVFVSDAWQECSDILGKMPSRNLARYISSYRTYLYLSNGPGSNKVDPGTVADYIIASGLFQSVADLNERTRYRLLLKELLSSYSKIDSTQAFVFDEGLARAAQNSIRSYWSWQDLLEELVERDTGLNEPLSAREFEAIECGHKIPHAFTFSGWSNYIGDRLDSAFNDIKNDSLIATILSDKLGKPDENPLIAEYNQRCKYEWIQFFDGLGYTREAVRSSDFFATLAGYNSPLKKLLIKASKEAIKEGELKRFFADLHSFTGASPSGGILDSLSPSSSEQKPPAIDSYIIAMGKINSSLDGMRGAAEGCAAKYSRTVSGINNARKEAHLDFVRSELSTKLTDFLVKPFGIGRGKAKALAVNCLNNGWTTLVYEVFQEELQPMYPFDENAHDDISDGTIDGFFAKDGPLRSFDKDEAVPTAKAARIRLYSQYEAARDTGRKISQLIRAGNTTVDFEFNTSLTPTGFRRLRVFDSDAASAIFSYANGPADRLKLKLPWESGRLNIHVEMTSDDQVSSPFFQGEWAPLRLMDWARINGSTGTLPFDNNVKVGFRLPNGSPLQLFRQFKPPKRICR